MTLHTVAEKMSVNNHKLFDIVEIHNKVAGEDLFVEIVSARSADEALKIFMDTKGRLLRGKKFKAIVCPDLIQKELKGFIK